MTRKKRRTGRLPAELQARYRIACWMSPPYSSPESAQLVTAAVDIFLRGCG